jgi:hypothetical protein
MSALDCCGVVTSYLQQWGVLLEPGFERIKAEKEQEVLGSGYSEDLVGSLVTGLSPLAQRAIDLWGASTGTAVDLGCGGKSTATIELLGRGWKVIAVDSSQVALEALQEFAVAKYSDCVSSGQLTLVCARIEGYRFPRHVEMILAIETFPYCDPPAF